MRIAYFSEVYWPMVSGVSHTLVRTVDALRRRGHAVRVYAPAYPLPPGVADRPEAHRSRGAPLFLDPLVQWATPRLREIVADLEAFRPDIMHVLTEFPMGRIGVRAARLLGVPVVASAHTDYEQYAPRYGLGWLLGAGWSYLRRHYAQAEVVLAPSRQFEARLRARGVLNTGIWSRSVDTTAFAPAHRSEAYRARMGCGPDDVLVTCVSRLAPEKGIPELLAAWDRLRSVRGSARLVLVGGGLLEARLRASRIEGVHLTGTLHGPELATAYASADLFVFPSTTETFGNVLLEAMASGVACLAMRAGGVTEFAHHGRNCVLADPAAPADFGNHLGGLLRDRAARDRLAAAGRDTALGRNGNAILDQLLLTYAGYTLRQARAA
jgi:glycosyltransferase involved in cell wall biosynthesis